VIALAGMALAVRAGQPTDRRPRDDVLGFSLCALTGLLVSPISWSHHWTLAVPALLLLAVGAYRRASIVALAAAGAIAIVAASHMIWWVPINHPAHSELHLDALQLVYASAYVLIGLAVLTIAAWQTLGAAPAHAQRAIAVWRGCLHDLRIRGSPPRPPAR